MVMKLFAKMLNYGMEIGRKANCNGLIRGDVVSLLLGPRDTEEFDVNGIGWNAASMKHRL